uniref:Phospholipase B-like n=1 Tax=Alexandrium monilatum TaxID=311494 RepID=A0A7S4W7L1_9DINO|mmetsp:Transcript_6611/g.20092  ORF Transcript_6611/g.20092 Transcript_6611/m.20092 type:complete len:303 (+) Transcript_6611:66-974(+)
MSSAVLWLAVLSALTAALRGGLLPKWLPGMNPFPAAKPGICTEDDQKSKSWAVPDVIIQWGDRRSATTLQFQTLCAAMLLMHSSEPEKVICHYWNGTIVWDVLLSNCYFGTYWVMKTHNSTAVRDFASVTFGRRIWFFATAMSTWDAQFVPWVLGVPVKYVQTMRQLSLKGYFIVTEYQRIFGLSDDQLEVLLQYMRYWHTLRQCCGRQMSFDFRFSLLNRTWRRHKKSSSMYHACEAYDIGAVERAVMNTRLITEHAVVPYVLKRASLIDGEFNGTWCTWYLRQVACQKLEDWLGPFEPYC